MISSSEKLSHRLLHQRRIRPRASTVLQTNQLPRDVNRLQPRNPWDLAQPMQRIPMTQRALPTLHQRLPPSNAARRNISHKPRVRIAIVSPLHIFRNFNDPVSDRLRPALRRQNPMPPRRSDERFRRRSRLHHLHPNPRREPSKILRRLPHILVRNRLSNRTHPPVILPRPALEIIHLPNQVLSRQPRQIRRFRMPLSRHQVARPARHFRNAALARNNPRCRPMLIRKPIWRRSIPRNLRRLIFLGTPRHPHHASSRFGRRLHLVRNVISPTRQPVRNRQRRLRRHHRRHHRSGKQNSKPSSHNR